jgi:hypothetical protein
MPLSKTSLVTTKNLTRKRHSIRLPKQTLPDVKLKTPLRGARTRTINSDHIFLTRGSPEALEVCNNVSLKHTFESTRTRDVIGRRYWPVLDVLVVKCDNPERYTIHDKDWTYGRLSKTHEFTILERSTLVVSESKRKGGGYDFITLYITSQEDPLLAHVMVGARQVHRDMEKFMPIKRRVWSMNQDVGKRKKGRVMLGKSGRIAWYRPLCSKTKRNQADCAKEGYKGKLYNDGMMHVFMPNREECKEKGKNCLRFQFQNISKQMPLSVSKFKAAFFERQMLYEKQVMPQVFANRQTIMKHMPCGAVPGVPVARMPITGFALSTSFANASHSDSCAKEVLEGIFYENDVSKDVSTPRNAFAVVKCRVLLPLSRHRFCCVFQRGDVEHGTPLLDDPHRMTHDRHIEVGKKHSIGTAAITKRWTSWFQKTDRPSQDVRGLIRPPSSSLAD